MVAGALRRLSVVVDIEDRASAQLDKLNDAGDRADSSLERNRRSAELATQAFKGFAVAAAAGTAAMAVLSRQGMDIDRTLAIVQATASATDAEMEELQDTINQIGIESPVAMSETADAALELTRAGFEAEQAMAALSSTVELAVAGQLAMGEAAAITAQLINAFTLDAEQAAAVTNTLAATSASSATEVGELGQAMSYVATTANQVGLSVSDTAGAIGVMADNGIEGSMAGTQLNQALLAVVNSSDKADEALATLGVTTDDFLNEEGELDLVRMVTTLRDRMEAAGMTGVEQAELLDEVFGVRGGRAVGTLIKDVEGLQDQIGNNLRAEIDAAADGLEDSDMLGWFQEMRAEVEAGLSETDLAERLVKEFGLSEEAAALLASQMADMNVDLAQFADETEEAVTAGEIQEAQMNTLGGQLEYVQGSIESLGNLMYQGFRPALLAIGRVAIGVVDVMGEFPTLFKVLGVALFGATAAAGALAVASAGLAAKLWLSRAAMIGVGNASFFQITALYTAQAATRAVAAAQWLLTASSAQVVGALTAKAGAAYAAATGTGVLTGALGALRTALWATMSALGPIGWALIGISAAFIAWESNLFGIQDKLKGVTDGTARLAGWLGNLLGVGRDLESGALAAGIDMLGRAFRAATGFVGGFLDWYERLPFLGKLIVGVLTGGLLPALWSLRDIFRALGDAAGWAGRAFERFHVWANGLFYGLKADVAGIGPFIANWFDRQVEGARGSLDRLRAIVSNKIDNAIASIHGKGEEIADQLIIDFQAAQDRLVAAFLNAGKGLVRALANGVRNSGGILKAAVKAALGPAAVLLPGSDAQEGPLSDVTGSGAGMMHAFAQGIRSERGTVRSAMEDVAADADEAADVTPETAGITDATKALQALRARVSTATVTANTARTTFSRLQSTARGAGSDGKRAMRRFGRAAIGFSDDLEDTNEEWKAFVGWMTDAVEFVLDLSPHVSALMDVWSWVTSAWGGVKDLLGWLGDLNVLDLDLSLLSDAFDPLIEKLESAWQWAVDLLAELDSVTTHPGPREGEEFERGDDELARQEEELAEERDITVSEEDVEWLRENMTPSEERRIHQLEGVPFGEELPEDALERYARQLKLRDEWEGPEQAPPADPADPADPAPPADPADSADPADPAEKPDKPPKPDKPEPPDLPEEPAEPPPDTPEGREAVEEVSDAIEGAEEQRRRAAQREQETGIPEEIRRQLEAARRKDEEDEDEDDEQESLAAAIPVGSDAQFSASVDPIAAGAAFLEPEDLPDQPGARGPGTVRRDHTSRAGDQTQQNEVRITNNVTVEAHGTGAQGGVTQGDLERALNEAYVQTQHDTLNLIYDTMWLGLDATGSSDTGTPAGDGVNAAADQPPEGGAEEDVVDTETGDTTATA